jgi:type IV pilus assembly protein PilX
VIVKRPGTISLNRRTTRGVALFVSLVLLLILTIIGVSAVQTTSLETRMARNEHDLLLGFQAAESALRDAEAFLETVVSTAAFSDTGNNGLWTMPPLGEPERWRTAAIWTGTGSVEAPTPVGEVVAASPRYFIEHIAAVIREENAYQIDDPYAYSSSDRVDIFRITALGTGGSGRSQVMLQTTYGRVLD